MPSGDSFPRLVHVMQRLLAPDGCPWDRQQTLQSLRAYLVEETYEVVDAIDSGDPQNHCEELGDLLFQIVFQSAISEFSVDDVIGGIADKLERRHPHVFGDARYQDVDWNALKRAEKGGRRTLEGIPRAMPALARAQRISQRAAEVGFDWPDVAGCRAKISEELQEVDQALAERSAEELHATARESADERLAGEVGDLLFAAVSFARKVGIDPEAALRSTNDKFERRFRYIEDRLQSVGRAPKDSTLEEMDELWEQAKRP